MKEIEIPFGAFDSELGGFEYTIPEGYEATIKDGKVIVKRKESEDERVRTRLIALVEAFGQGKYKDEMLAYLEKHKEQKSIEDVIKNITKNKEAATKFLKSAGIMNDNGELAEMYRSEQPAEWSEEDKKQMSFLLEILYNEMAVSTSDTDRENLYEGISWLKSLRPQPHFADVSKMEQPEADLEKELENFARQYPMEHSGSYRNLMTLARHFYELGKQAK